MKTYHTKNQSIWRRQESPAAAAAETEYVTGKPMVSEKENEAAVS